MYKELLSGNANLISIDDDPVFLGLTFFTGPGEVKFAYNITAEATEAIMKQWGKTNGKKVVRLFQNLLRKDLLVSLELMGSKELVVLIKMGRIIYLR
ncbi:hypothetical protein [Paenibacillus polymyxa]|uniref:hypothetical protein n=1 Tax=Paenibacillus polymyxa TaxID=1406 RepID=UPI002AB40099|nr:hypothetical protein [Paenibacillus polymyxa]MDY8025663.1 hypothetical protein [Paenibacillus polymyxa]